MFNAQHGADWQEVLSELATDGATAHGAHSEGEAQRLYEALVLQNQHFVKKGTYAKQSAWYSIVEAIAHHDKLFIPWRFLLTQVARDLLRQGTKLSELQEKAVKTLKEVADLPHAGLDDQQTKEHREKAIQEMKKKAGAGQQIVLCPLLMHNWNWFNMRLVLLFGQYMWSEQTLLSTEKTTPEQHFTYVLSISTGHGEDLLRLLWHGGTCDAKEWARLGVALYPGQDKTDMSPHRDPITQMHVPGVAEKNIPGHLASLMWNLIEERFWTYAEVQHRWPGIFAGILHETAHGSVLEFSSQFWEACLFAEARRNVHPGFFTLREQVYWMDWPVCQLPFRLLGQCHFRRHPEITKYFRRQFVRMGDSKVVEETHKIVRRIEEKEQDGHVAAAKRIYHALAGHDEESPKRTTDHGVVGSSHDPTLKRSPLEWRGVNIACVPSSSYYEVNSNITRPPPGGWAKTFDAKATPLPRSWGARNVLDSHKTYVNKRPQDARHSIAAAMALLGLHKTGSWAEAGNAWHCCAILPHTFVRKKKNHQHCPQQWFCR